MAELLTNAFTARINMPGGLFPGITLVTVTDASLWPGTGTFRLFVDQEILEVTGVSGNDVTVIRGAESTTDSFHAQGAEITNILTAEALNGLIASITTGPAGTPGTVFRDGAGAPSNALGINGDFYLNTTNGDVYTKAAGVYTVTGNIKGATGATGATGAAGATGATGAAGATNINEGNIGAEPGGEPSGALYLVDNGTVLERYNGATWQPFGPIYKLVPFIKGNFAWINQGTSTATDNGNSGTLISGQLVTTVNARILKKAALTTPYSIDVIWTFIQALSVTTIAGFVWRNSTSGKLVTFGFAALGTSVWEFVDSQWNSPTAYSTQLVKTIPMLMSNMLVRFSDDGTNRSISLSLNGKDFTQLYQEARTTFITPDEIGFFVETQSNEVAPQVNILSWYEH